MDFQVEQEKSLANVQDRKAQVKTAATKLAASESNYERVEKLYEMNGATLGDYERAKADLEIAESNLQAAKAQLAVTENRRNCIEQGSLHYADGSLFPVSSRPVQ